MRPVSPRRITPRSRPAEAVAMGRESNQPAPAMSGIEPREEHELRVWTAIAMWLAGGCAIAVGTVLPGQGALHVVELRWLVGFGLLAALFTFVVFRPASNRTLYVLTNIFSALGTLTVWFACLWSGGTSSAFIELYFFPALYVAYFFRRAHAVCHLALITALAASPLLYGGSATADQFPGHLVVLVAGLWGMAAVVGYRKRRLLLAEMASRRQALSDPLTGVHNLRSLRDRAAQGPLAEGSGVLVIDIDDFKAVNTEYGHTGADALLRSVALELQDLAEPSDCVARIGGDEFAVLVSGRSRPEIEALAQRCVQAIGRARARAGLDGPDVSGSVGCALWPEDGRTLTDLLAVADGRMFDSKAGRREPGEVHPADTEDAPPFAAARAVRLDQPAVSGPRPRLVAAGATRARAPGAGGGPAAGWWRSRPSKALAAGTAWLSASATTLVVVLLPGADRSHLLLVALLIACAAAMGLFILSVGPALGDTGYLVSDALAVMGIAGGVYLTGGPTSPLLPLVFLAVTFATFFSTPRGATPRVAGALLVCASPFAYASGDAGLLFVLRFVAVASTVLVLVGIVLYNKRELAQAEEAARELASHDPLTGLPNRRAFHENVSYGLDRASAEAEPPLSIAMIDLDNFKRVNDKFGHAAGDIVLQAISDALSAVTRPGDCVARIGGDEFALVAYGVDMSAGRALGIRCVRAVEAAVADAGYADCGVSATVGYALFPHHGTTLDTLLESADSALMYAKDSGKRRVGCAVGQASSA